MEEKKYLRRLVILSVIMGVLHAIDLVVAIVMGMALTIVVDAVLLIFNILCLVAAYNDDASIYNIAFVLGIIVSVWNVLEFALSAIVLIFASFIGIGISITSYPLLMKSDIYAGLFGATGITITIVLVITIFVVLLFLQLFVVIATLVSTCDAKKLKDAKSSNVLAFSVLEVDPKLAQEAPLMANPYPVNPIPLQGTPMMVPA